MRTIPLTILFICISAGFSCADKFTDGTLGKDGPRLPESFYLTPEELNKAPENNFPKSGYYENIYKNSDEHRYNKNGWLERNSNPHTGRMGTDSPYKGDFFQEEKSFEIRKEF